MRQTLFNIPAHVGELQLFGFGPVLWAWLALCAVVLAWVFFKRGGKAEALGLLPTMGLVAAAIAFVLPKLIAGEGLPIRGFGVMLLLGIVAGLWLAVRRARQMRVDPEIIFSLATWLFVAGILGARAYYVIQKWEEFRLPNASWGEQLVNVLNVTNGGLVVYGSVIGAGLALLAFSRRHRLPPLALLDLIAPSLLAGLAIGRVGCLMNGCCFGGTCDLPWSVTFPYGSPPYIRQVQRGMLDAHGVLLDESRKDAAVIQKVLPGSPAERAGLQAGQRIAGINGQKIDDREQAQSMLLVLREPGQTLSIVTGTETLARHAWNIPNELPRSLPIHPTQIYSTIDAAILCMFLWCYYPFRGREGETTAWMITVYPVSRFLVESIRTDEPKSIVGMTTAQVLSLALLFLAGGLWVWLWKQPRGTIFGGRDFVMPGSS